jgi:Tfp pilus assembly PilM family ATPase
MSGTVLVLEVESERLLVIEAELRGGRPHVRRAISTDVPAGAAVPAGTTAEPGQDEPARTGAWLRALLDEHGFKARRAIVAVSRAHVVTKRFDDAGGSLSPTERHQMIHLQMTRQASLTSGESVIDYTVSEPGGVVTAAAMPAERVARRRAVAKAAGLRLAGIRLRSAGLRALLSQQASTAGGVAGDDRCGLVVAPGVGSVEILIVRDGEVVYSRSIATDGADSTDSGSDDGAVARRVAVEAARSVVSFRVAPEGADVMDVTVVASAALGARLAAEIGERLDLPVRTLEPSEVITFDDGVAETDRFRAVPLAGLLLCARGPRTALDFANPAAPPDTGATARQAVLAGLFVVIVLGGAGYLFAQSRLADERAALASLQTDHDDAQSRWVDAQLTGARLGHARAWTADNIDWLAHLGAVIERLPAPTDAALGELSAEISRRAVFQPGGAIGDQAAWTTESALSIRVTGVARDRLDAQGFRERLLETEAFTVSSQGPEVENRFAIVITTDRPTPEPETAPTETAPTETAPTESRTGHDRCRRDAGRGGTAMNTRVRSVLLAGGALVISAIAWFAFKSVYLDEHREIAAERDRLETATEAYTSATVGSREARIALRELASTMLGREPTVVEHRLRGLLSELAARESLGSVVVTHGRPRVAASPAGERGSGVARGFRRLLGDRQDFAVVGARLQGLGTLEQCLSTLAAARAQPWVHRVEGFSISPKGRDNAAYEIKIDLATVFAPDLVPADAEAPGLLEADPADVARVARVVARDPFRLAEPAVAAAPAPPRPPSVEKPEPAPPYDKWRVVGVLIVGARGDPQAGIEVMLARTDTPETRTLKPGDPILGARLESASGETAVFVLDGTRVAVRTGQTLNQAVPAESVHSARSTRP